MYNFKPFTRGEPIDVTGLAKMSEYIANINEQLLANRTAKSSPYSPVRTHVETPDMTIWTGKQLLVEGSVPNPDMRALNWSAAFDIPFKTVPIVTATVYCDTNTGTGPGTIAPSAVWITEITTTGVKGKWKWITDRTSQPETVFALIIAIGEGAVA